MNMVSMEGIEDVEVGGKEGEKDGQWQVERWMLDVDLRPAAAQT